MPRFVRTQEIEHRIGPSGRFALRVTSPDVEIKGSDDPIARVRVTLELRAESEADADELLEHARFDVRESDGALEVNEPRHGETGLNALAHIFRTGRSTTVGVAVEVPRGSELEYQGVSADVTVTDLNGLQRYQTVSGDLVLERVSGNVRMQGVSADVSLRADSPVALAAHSVSGDLSAFAPTFTSLRASTVSGDIELEGALDVGGSHSIETVSGDLALGAVGGLTLEVRGLSTDVDVNLPHRAEGSRDQRRYVVGAGAPHVLFSSMSGDVSLRASRRLAQMRPEPSVPPRAPAPPGAGTPPEPPPGADAQLAVLRALERGEIDIDEASRRLARGADDV